MEQCVARLDVAMFNAILRESADDMPTDPVSDPISDPKVLPVPAGKSSFGSGAQLKNAVRSFLFYVHFVCCFHVIADYIYLPLSICLKTDSCPVTDESCYENEFS